VRQNPKEDDTTKPENSPRHKWIVPSSHRRREATNPGKSHGRDSIKPLNTARRKKEPTIIFIKTYQSLNQYASALTTSPPAIVARARQAAILTESLTKRTDPSARSVLTPPECRLRAAFQPWYCWRRQS